MSDLALYVPGSSPLHRAPAAAKVIALVIIEVIIAATVTGPVAAVAALIGLAVMIMVARLPAATVWRQLRMIMILGVVVGVAHVVVGLGSAPAVSRGIGLGAQLIVAVGVAVIITATTRLSALLDMVQRGLRPLRRFGVDPERTATLLVLAIRSVPVVAGMWAEIRDANRARGLGFVPTALGVPLIVRSLRHAEQLGEALQARGFDD